MTTRELIDFINSKLSGPNMPSPGREIPPAVAERLAQQMCFMKGHRPDSWETCLECLAETILES